jgi:hypothetical protein
MTNCAAHTRRALAADTYAERRRVIGEMEESR